MLVVDFMSLLRLLPMKDFQKFQGLLVAGWNYIKGACKFSELHIVFDSNIAGSLKECERERRSTCDPLHFHDLTPSTKVPSRPERFWACGKNKEKLQRLSRTFFINVSKEMDISIILNGFVAFDGEINNSFKLQRENSVIHQDLTSEIEDPDIRIIPHVSQAIKEKSSNIVILLNDADVVVLVLYYMEKFVREGLQKLWIKYGTGDHTRYLPVHINYEKLDASFSSVLLDAHILTGCDMTSKVGTKESAIKVKPDKFSHAFGSTDEINYLRQSEEYLVKVVSRTTRCTTFDELRFENYTGKKASLINLPPTSNSIKGHLYRCFFIIQQQTSIFNKTENHPDPWSG